MPTGICLMNSHTKNYGTKPVPMERVFNAEHFDMRLDTMHLMVPELLVSMVPMALPILLIKKA